MGMDVYGKFPTSTKGEYFRRNMWGWHPLWDMVEALCPWVAEKVTYGHSNDGDGLNDEDSQFLAVQLRELLDTGVVEQYVRLRNERLDATPDEECKYCEGTGTRSDEVGVKHGMVERKWCNVCQGKGKIRPFATWYSLEEDDVVEFAEFLDACGGFQIC